MKRDKRLSEVSEKLYRDSFSDARSENVVPLFVMAPVMYCFVKWVLQEAQRTQTKKLYFCARDGYSMYQVAKEICAIEKINIECRYFYCSRYALRSAHFFLMGTESLDYICLGGINVSFEKLMYRAGLCKEEAEQIAKRLGYQDTMYMPMTYAQVKNMKPVLQGCEEFMQLVKEKAKEKYPQVCGYLKQEGLLEPEKYAFVDSGWTGSMQVSICQLLSSMGEEKQLEGYYFGMYEYPSGVKKSDYHCYYFEPNSGLRKKVYFSNSLFECIFSSPEGMTLSYRQEDKRFLPVFEREMNPNRNAIERSTTLLVQYAKRVLQDYPNDFLIMEDKRTVVMQLLETFMGKPTKNEAEYFGGYVFCDDVRGEENQTVAAKMSYAEMKQNHLIPKSIGMLRRQGVPVCESAWLEGSTVLVEQAKKRDLRQCALYKYILYLRKSMK